jgi:hypothetical protein
VVKANSVLMMGLIQDSTGVEKFVRG